MTRLLTCATLLIVPTLLIAQTGKDKIPARFNVDADIDKYPQATPKDALRSVLKAIDGKRIDYLLAHLADPAFADKSVKDAKGKFDVVVKEVSNKFENDPEGIRDLRKFLSDGTFPRAEGDSIEIKCPEIKSKRLFMKKIGSRWFLDNRTDGEKVKEKEKEKDKDADKEKDKEKE